MSSVTKQYEGEYFGQICFATIHVCMRYTLTIQFYSFFLITNIALLKIIYFHEVIGVLEHAESCTSGLSSSKRSKC